MRIIFAFYFFVFFVTSALAQFESVISPKDTVRMYGEWENGERTGEWVAQHENENIRWIGSFVEGKANGEWRYFYESGLPDKVCQFDSGRLESLTRYPNLSKELTKVEIDIESPIDARLSAEFLYHDRVLGQVMHQMLARDLGGENIDEDVKTLQEYIGPSLIYYGPDALMNYSDYRFEKAVQTIDSLRTTYSVDYWLNRSLDFSYLSFDKLDRKVEKMVIDPEGRLRYTTWTYYTDDPQKIYEKLVYVDGILREAYYSYRDEGNYQADFYWKNGEVHHTGRYKEGKKHGRWEYYDMNGKLIKVEHYRMGRFND
ncbi:toxin-antitoxin system YwqK family antitoxin [Halocola ammonii]